MTDAPQDGKPQELRERLAALCHEQWCGWLRYMFSVATSNNTQGWLFSRDCADRWHRQVETPYVELSEAEKASDRAEADRFIVLLGQAYVPAAGIAALLQQWREEAKQEARDRDPGWVGAQAALDKCADDLESLLTGSRCPWQPIETAPKDGTVFLAWHEDDRQPELVWWSCGDRALGLEACWILRDDGTTVHSDWLKWWMPVSDPNQLTGSRSLWRNIETAPKDGTWFLGWEAGEPQSVLRWDTDVDDRYPDWRDGECYRHEPTHWMKLPDPPTTGSRSRPTEEEPT